MLIRALRNDRAFEAEGTPGGPTPVTPPAQATTSAEKLFSAEYVKELRGEAKANREKASALETELNSLKAASEAQKTASEKAIEKANARFEEIQKAADMRLIRTEVRAGAKENGIVDIDFLKLIDITGFKVNDEGEVEVPKDFWKALRESKPHFFTATGAEKGTTTNTQPAPRPSSFKGKKATELSDAEYKAALARIERGLSPL